MSPSKRWSGVRGGSVTRQLHQDSTGSVVVPDEGKSLFATKALIWKLKIILK